MPTPTHEHSRVTYRAMPSPWGWLAVVGDGRTVGRILLARRTESALIRQVRSAYPTARQTIRSYAGCCRLLGRYFAGRPVTMDVPVDLAGLSPFQQHVLRACRDIPFGRVWTYRQLAEHVGHARACHAVGAALARNPVPLIIPCHRVVHSDGTLGGFSAMGGTRLKRRLLAHEGCTVQSDRVATCG